MGKQRWEYWQKSLHDELPGGEGDPNVKKYKKLWGNTPKFNSFVVVTAFYLKLEGRFE